MNPLQNINFSNLASLYYGELTKKSRKNSLTISERIEDLVRSADFGGHSSEEKKVLQYLRDETNLREIVIAVPSTLESFCTHFDKCLFWDGKKPTPFGSLVLNNIFKYDNFRKGKVAKWLAKALGIKTCLYCNGQFCLSTGKKIYHTFDHFFSKKKYPILSLSFYNLIPSCDNCNRTKSDKDMNLKDYKHPYDVINPLIDEFKFKIASDSEILFRTGNYRDDQILKIKLDDMGSKFAKNHIDMFKLEDRYSIQKDIAAELIWKSVIYSKPYLDDLEKLLNKTGVNKQELKRIILANYPQKDDFHKRPLAKFMNDLAEDLKLF